MLAADQETLSVDERFVLELLKCSPWPLSGLNITSTARVAGVGASSEALYDLQHRGLVDSMVGANGTTFYFLTEAGAAISTREPPTSQ